MLLNESCKHSLSSDRLGIPSHEPSTRGKQGLRSGERCSFPGLRIRIVEYSPGYLADHWCQKGHIVHCLEGEFVNEQQDGAKTIMRQGMTYVVSDEASSHRSRTENGATLLIIDGDFLRNREL